VIAICTPPGRFEKRCEPQACDHGPQVRRRDKLFSNMPDALEVISMAATGDDDDDGYGYVAKHLHLSAQLPRGPSPRWSRR